jgi:7-cyano-7-deazaguanine synthase in queuosine biosynthesis
VSDATPPHVGGEADLQDKARVLRGTLAGYESLLIAFSGGADSAYLAWEATSVLGSSALCITADSPSYPDHHRQLALRIAREFGLRHEIIHTAELDRPSTGPIRPTAATTVSTSSTPRCLELVPSEAFDDC